MATPVNLPTNFTSSEMIPLKLMDKLTYEDKILNTGISNLIQQLTQEKFQEAFNELNQLQNKDLKDRITKVLNYPRSSVEIAAMIKVLALPFIKGTKQFEGEIKDLAGQFKKELADASRLAGFYEGSHRNIEVDCPMPLSQALLSGRMSRTHHGQCDLHIFNGLDGIPMTVTNKDAVQNFPTRMILEDAIQTHFTADTQFVFNGNVKASTNAVNKGKPVVEVFWLDEDTHRTAHRYMFGGNAVNAPNPDLSFDIDQALTDENSPIRGLAAQEYESLKSSTRIYDNGRVVAFELTSILNKIDRIFPISIQRYLQATRSTGLVLNLEGGAYHVVHLTSPFQWDAPTTFLTSEVNNFWRSWAAPAAANNGAELTETQRSAYTALGIMKDSPLFRTTSQQITLSNNGAFIADSSDPTNVAITTFKANVTTTMPNALDPMGTLFRDIISGQVPIEPPQVNADRAIYSISPNLYMGIDPYYGFSDASRRTRIRMMDVAFIDAEGLQVIGEGLPINEANAAAAAAGISAAGISAAAIADVSAATVDLLQSQNRREFRSIRCNTGTPTITTETGEMLPLMRLTHRPMYPNTLLQRIINSVSFLNADGKELEIFSIKPLKRLIFEFAVTSDFLFQALTPTDTTVIPASIGSDVLTKWGNTLEVPRRFIPQVRAPAASAQQFPAAGINPPAAAAAAGVANAPNSLDELLAGVVDDSSGDEKDGES